MPCVCGSFQCACQEKCTCWADDCHCKRCNEIRSDGSLTSYGSGAKGSPTHGATALLTNLQISGGQSTQSSNYPDPNLLFPGRISHAKSLSSASQQSAQEICAHSSPESLKKRSPKRKYTPTKEELSGLGIKRPSPCKSNIPSRTRHVCASQFDIEKPSQSKNSESDEIGPHNQSANLSKSLTSDSNTSQDTPPIHSLRKSWSMSDISCTSFESEYTATTQKNTRASTESIYAHCSCSADSSAPKKRFSPSHSIKKNIGKFKLKSASYQKYIRKFKFSGKGKSISGQSKSGISISKQMSIESPEISQPSSSTGSCHEAYASASPKSSEQSIVKGGTSNPLKSSQQAFSRQKSPASKKPVSSTESVDISRRFTGANTSDESYDDLSQRWFDDDDRSDFAPDESDSAASSAIESADDLNPERHYQRSDSEVSNNSENQVVPDIG